MEPLAVYLTLEYNNVIQFRFYSIHKHNLKLILDDHVKEIKETPGPDKDAGGG